MLRPAPNQLADLAVACAAVPVPLISLARARFLWGGGWEGVATGFVLLSVSGIACLVPFAFGMAAMIRGTETPVRALIAVLVPKLIVSVAWSSA